MTSIYARLKNQYEFNYHKLFSTNFCKTNGKDQRNEELELFIN